MISITTKTFRHNWNVLPRKIEFTYQYLNKRCLVYFVMSIKRWCRVVYLILLFSWFCHNFGKNWCGLKLKYPFYWKNKGNCSELWVSLLFPLLFLYFDRSAKKCCKWNKTKLMFVSMARNLKIDEKKMILKSRTSQFHINIKST